MQKRPTPPSPPSTPHTLGIYTEYSEEYKYVIDANIYVTYRLIAPVSSYLFYLVDLKIKLQLNVLNQQQTLR